MALEFGNDQRPPHTPRRCRPVACLALVRHRAGFSNMVESRTAVGARAAAADGVVRLVAPARDLT